MFSIKPHDVDKLVTLTNYFVSPTFDHIAVWSDYNSIIVTP